MSVKRFLPKTDERAPGLHRFELAFSAGPLVIAQTGQNRLLDFIGGRWALEMQGDMTLHLYQQGTLGEWVPVTTQLPSVVFGAPLPVGARHITFCFDQSARIVVAYDISGTAFVTRWDAVTSAYVQNVTIAGVDPVTVFDATWAYNIPTSDVLLFYLSSDRTRLMCRVQRDLFSIEYELHVFGAPVVLDRVTRLPHRYQVLASDAAGEPLEDVSGRYGLRSNVYPVLVGESLAVGAQVLDGAYEPAVIVHRPSEQVGLTGIVLDGTYDLVLRIEPAAEPIGLDGFLHDGTYVSAVIIEGVEESVVGLSGFLHDGSYDFVLLIYDRTGDTVGLTATLQNGSYELA